MSSVRACRKSSALTSSTGSAGLVAGVPAVGGAVVSVDIGESRSYRARDGRRAHPTSPTVLFERAQDGVWGGGGSVCPLREGDPAGEVVPRRPDDHRFGG